MSKLTRRDSLRRKTGLALFSAIIVVLTVLSTFVRFGPFSITLALVPIIVGSAVYGSSAGALLGGVLGFVVLLTGVFGWDGGTIMLLMGIDPLACIVICIGKTVAAGYAAGLAYRLAAKRSERAAVLLGGIVCPVVNTGLFILGMLGFYMSTLESWAGGQNLLYYALIGLAGVNFLVELAVNLVLASGITTIIKHAGRNKT